MKIKEEIVNYGAAKVADAGLVSLVCGCTMQEANRLLDVLCGDIGQALDLIPGEIAGIGESQIARLRAAIELGLRCNKKLQKLDGCSPAAVFDCMHDMRFLQQEHFRCLLLDAKMNIFKVAEISVGTVNTSLVHPREVFSKAIRHHAVSVILTHNHPSGDPEPSYEDILITNRMKEAGELLGIKIVDHVIIARNEYYSFQEHCNI